MSSKPNVLQLAVKAAGGVNLVADKFGMNSNTTYAAIKRRDWPLHLLRPLCAAGGHVITIEQLLAYFEEWAEDKETEANVG